MPWMTRLTWVVVCASLILTGSAGCVSWPLDARRVDPPSSPTVTRPATSQVAAPLSVASIARDPAPETGSSSPPGPSTAGEVPELTLERLIQIALENQPRIRNAEAVRRGAEARVGTARAGYYPTINTTLGYNRSTANIAGGISPATGNPIERHVSGTSVNNQNFTASLSQNVFDSFRREWRVQAAREDLNAAGFDLSTTRQDVILNVQQTYYNYLLAVRLVEVSQEAVERNIQNLNRAKGFFEVGTRPKIDVTRAQVDLANSELDLVRARNRVATTLTALNNAIGVPDHPPYRLKEELEITPTPGLLEESIRKALESRTELRALQARIRSAEASLTLSRRNFLPSLSGDANWNYRGQEFPLAPNWLAGVTLTVPVLNPPLFSQRDEAAATLAAAQASAEITQQNIILEVQQNYLALEEARERIRTTEVLLLQSRENLELAEGRYQVGVGPLIDVTDAQLALTRAKSENIQALIDFKLAEFQLRKASGLLE